MQDIREPDWKIFRELHPIVLNRFCEQLLSEVNRLASGKSGGAHDRYLQVYKLIKERDKEIASTFDDPNRSRAIQQMAVMRFRGLFTDQEFARFSDATRERVTTLIEILIPTTKS